MDGAFDTYWQKPSASSEQLAQISGALQATLDPRVSNDVRQQALQHLEQTKRQADAPHYGFALAEDWGQSDAVRYYGLQLLEFAVRYRWNEYSERQTDQLRTWVKCLAGSLREQDAVFLRNKIAQLWVEVAKRCWGEEWMDMDTQLVSLWDRPISEKGVANKIMVLYILETLSEDIINNEDAVAGLRLDVLGHALNEIIVPEGLYAEHAITRGNRQEVRCGKEGWLARICDLFASLVKQARLGGPQEMMEHVSTCAVKALNALRPTMTWVSLKGVVEGKCVDCLFLPFYTEDVALQTAATEVLYALLSRPYNSHWHEAWSSLLQQAMRPDRVAMIRHTYEQTSSGPGEDDAKYTLQKKMSEVLSLLSDAIAQQPQLADSKLDLPALFDLLLIILQSKSLTVSIPILHSWSRMMSVQDTNLVELLLQALGTLIQTCSERLLRYESLPDDFNDDVLRYLHEDFDTMPERHAFLGNYRRYCVTVIQAIARSRPLDALTHVLEQMRVMIQDGPFTGARGFDPSQYSKTVPAVLQLDAQFHVVSSALKGFSLWSADMASMTLEEDLLQRVERDKAGVVDILQQWGHAMINMHVDDPEVAGQILQTLVAILKTIEPAPAFVLAVVQHLLTMRLYDNPAHAQFSDAVKAFEALRVLELQKLALVFSNELLEVYHELEPRIGVLAQKHSDDLRLVWGYKAFLFMIIHRASGIEREARLARLQEMLEPVYVAWQAPSLSASVADLHHFCECLGLGGIADFYTAYRFDQVPDWASQQLDPAGQARQAEIKSKNDELPLRMTKSMLAATTEKLKPGTVEFETAAALWGRVIPVVLPNLLQMLRHAQAFHNMANWSHLPPSTQAVVKRTLQDRFWQSGISSESKDEFYARISGSKTSYEGIASVIRGTMRNVREQGYHILYLMTKFDEQFYGLSDLAGPLAEALFADAEALSANHLHPIINVTTGLVQRCPAHHRATFLPPLLTRLFTKMDAKVSSEWESLGQVSEQHAVDDELSDEMRTESVLRQLTYSMVSFVPFLLEYDKPTPAAANGHAATGQPTLSDVMLADPTVLEPMMLFCTHALRMRDARCCVTICRVFRSIIPLFQPDAEAADAPAAAATAAAAPQVREFICTEVLKACITSLHEPYFAELQKDLAGLIAQILRLHAPHTGTPRAVLLSLPALAAAPVDRAIAKVCKAGPERQQRALVLELLDGVRGVGIHEGGRVARAGPRAPPAAAGKSGVRPQYLDAAAPGAGPARALTTTTTPARDDDADDGLAAVADLFDGA